MKKFLIFSLLFFVSCAAFAFGGGGGGGHSDRTHRRYESGVDAMGIHIDGDSSNPDIDFRDCTDGETLIGRICCPNDRVLNSSICCNQGYLPVDGACQKQCDEGLVPQGDVCEDLCAEYTERKCAKCDWHTGSPVFDPNNDQDCVLNSHCVDIDQCACDNDTWHSGDECLDCPEHATCDGTENFTCDAGYTLNATGNGCIPCTAGYYKEMAGNTACTICEAGTYSNSGATACLHCDGSCTYSPAGASSCSICGDAKIANNTHTACDNAPGGDKTCGGCAYGADGTGSCRLCEPNTKNGCENDYICNTTGTQCNKCAEYYFMTTNGCQPCNTPGYLNAKTKEDGEFCAQYGQEYARFFTKKPSAGNYETLWCGNTNLTNALATNMDDPSQCYACGNRFIRSDNHQCIHCSDVGKLPVDSATNCINACAASGYPRFYSSTGRCVLCSNSSSGGDELRITSTEAIGWCINSCTNSTPRCVSPQGYCQLASACTTSGCMCTVPTE